MTEVDEPERIKQMLSIGQLTKADPVTGYHYSLYSRCSNDGRDSPVHRIERSGIVITRLVFRCPICSREFDASPKEMFFR